MSYKIKYNNIYVSIKRNHREKRSREIIKKCKSSLNAQHQKKIVIIIKMLLRIFLRYWFTCIFSVEKCYKIAEKPKTY